MTVTIVEKDASVLSVSNAGAAEDGGNVVFTVSISAAAGEEVTVDYATSDVTATQGQDYESTTGTLTFAANSVASQTISVPVTDDTVDEDEEETFTLTLSNVKVASLAGGGETLAVTGTITDDDDPAVTASFKQSSYSVAEGGTVEVTVTLSADPEREVAVQADPRSTGRHRLGRLQRRAWERGLPNRRHGEVVHIQRGCRRHRRRRRERGAGLRDNARRRHRRDHGHGDHHRRRRTAGVTVSETALSIDEGGSGTYTVVLDSQPTGNVTVAIAGHAGTDLSLDKTSLTFTASTWDTAQTVTVTAAEDDDAASDTAVTLTHTANGGGYVDVQETVTVTVVEKDASVLSVGNAEAVEDGGNVEFTVSISAASGEEVTVDYATSDVTATQGQDYTDPPLARLPSRPTRLRVRPSRCRSPTTRWTRKRKETFTLTLSNVQGASLAGGGETLAVTGTITDDDDPAVTASFGQAVLQRE